MRRRYIERHLRHWRNLLTIADSDHFSADALRESLDGLDQAIKLIRWQRRACA
jgi:hypothetical protein